MVYPIRPLDHGIRDAPPVTADPHSQPAYDALLVLLSAVAYIPGYPHEVLVVSFEQVAGHHPDVRVRRVDVYISGAFREHLLQGFEATEFLRTHHASDQDHVGAPAHVTHLPVEQGVPVDGGRAVTMCFNVVFPFRAHLEDGGIHAVRVYRSEGDVDDAEIHLEHHVVTFF